MAPIFASPDIAAIVAAFPPPVPSKGNATLLRSASGERLLHSNKVLARLEKTLASNSERLEVSQLPSLLDVKDASGLLESAETTFFYSRDRSKLISVLEQRKLQDELEAKTLSNFVHLDEWSEGRDVERRFHDHSIDSSKVLLLHTTSDGKRFAYQQSHFETCQRDLGNLVKKTRPEKCYVHEALPQTPTNLHLWIANATIATQKLEASAHMDIHQINVTPDEYYAYQDRIRSMQAEDEMRRLIRRLDDYGSVEVKDEVTAGTLARQWELVRSGEVLYRWKLRHGHGGVVLADRMLSESVRRILLDLSRESLRVAWEKSQLDTLPDVGADDVNVLLNSMKDGELSANDQIGMRVRRLAVFVIRCEEFPDMFSTECAQYLDTLTAVEEAKWNVVIGDRIWYPFDLYRNGVTFLATFAKEVTKGPCPDHREAMMLAIDQEHIRPAIKHARETALLRKRSRRSNFQFFIAHSATASPPDSMELFKASERLLQQYRVPKTALRKRFTKFLILHNKVGKIKRSTDGAWIMQNLIWILMSQVAQERGADVLFASAGKDFSKMLRLYLQLVDNTGDDDAKAHGRRKYQAVADFKQKVLSKSVTQGDLEAMKMLAESSVTEMRSGGDEPAFPAETAEVANGEAVARTGTRTGSQDYPVDLTMSDAQ